MIDVVIPRMPPKELTPNGVRRTHWASRGRLVAEVRAEAKYEAREQAPSLQDKLTGEVHFTAVIGLTKGSKQLDPTNAEGWLKNMIDGLADHFSNGNDRRWFCDGVTFARDKTGLGWVQFVIEWEG